MNIYQINFNIDYSQWSKLFLSVHKPTLSQSWAYGEAKVKGQTWEVTRGVITENEKPIALIQAWYKKILFFKLVRISYGPLWIIQKPSSEQIRGVLHAIKKFWNLKNFSALSIAPNLENTPEGNTILTELGYQKRKSRPHESGLINIMPSHQDMRATLRKNWRRHLNASEKVGLTFNVSREYSDFKWMISCFETLRKEKNFYGHSVSLLDALHHSSTDFHETSVAIVSHGAERVAGILISYHGSSCTPLVSWLNEKGRALHAGNFLVWNSVPYAKSKGYAFFDLGNTQDNSFKTGLPHTHYQLIGEYYFFI